MTARRHGVSARSDKNGLKSEKGGEGCTTLCGGKPRFLHFQRANLWYVTYISGMVSVVKALLPSSLFQVVFLGTGSVEKDAETLSSKALEVGPGATQDGGFRVVGW